MLKYYLLVRDIVISIFNTIFVLLLNIFLLPFRVFGMKRIDFGCRTRRAHVIGTGPSLKTDLDRLKAEISEDDSIVCVNGFATSDLFQELKPNIYILADTAFFRDSNSPQSKQVVDDIYKAIIEKTTWNLKLVVPQTKIKSPQLKKFKINKNVEIYPLLNIPVTGGFISYNALLFYMRAANPLYQNVLVAAIYLSVRSGFEEICLWGADHNWLNQRTVLADNRTYSYNRHFYDKGDNPLKIIENAPFMHVQLECIERCFRAYHEIKKYAQYKGAKIYNYSSSSWIDSFVRR